jgi:hypothetical protein
MEEEEKGALLGSTKSQVVKHRGNSAHRRQFLFWDIFAGLHGSRPSRSISWESLGRGLWPSQVLGNVSAMIGGVLGGFLA